MLMNSKMSEPDSPWYAIVQDVDLHQGDFLDEVPIITPPYSLLELRGKPVGSVSEGSHSIKIYNVVVMTQSCDLADYRDEDPVILCPRYSYQALTDNEEKNAKRNQKKYYGSNRWGNYAKEAVIGKRLLNRCDFEGFKLDYQLVDLRQIFSVPYKFVKTIVEQKSSRVRLLPPYREHLAQAFAIQFMRIGLQKTIPRDYPYD